MKEETKAQTKIPTLLRLRNLCFIIYFALLLCERLAGGILGIFYGGKESMLGSETFIPKLVHPLALVAIAAGIAVMWKQWVPLFRSLSGQDAPLNTCALSAGVGCFLLSGMLHTGFLILPVQFTAYGFIIIGLILHIINFLGEISVKERVLSTAYVVCFSMTIPVVYDTALQSAQGVAFIIVELITTVYLVYAFAAMTEVFLRTGRCNLNPAVLVAMLITVGATFFLRLAEYANWLIAVFAILTLIVWICALILNRKSIRFSVNPFNFKPADER